METDTRNVERGYGSRGASSLVHLGSPSTGKRRGPDEGGRSSWLTNARGEWFVVGQAGFMLAVLAAPALDGRSVSLSGITGAAGGLLCVVGLGSVVLGSIALGRRNLSPFPKPTEKATLVEDGIFRVVRHPIYAGFTLAAVGWSLMCTSIAALVAAILLLVFFDVKARREERWLEERFTDYAAYKSRVKKLIPSVY
jgi:protein-S-isoprenylcysteine O-methyltransferase Ste14